MSVSKALFYLFKIVISHVSPQILSSNGADRQRQAPRSHKLSVLWIFNLSYWRRYVPAEFYLSLSVITSIATQDETPIVHCAYCNHVFCHKHRVVWEDGHNCDTYEIFQAGSNMHGCPNCKVLVSAELKP